MAKFFSETDCKPDIVLASGVSIIGYGNQGRAQALNLRDQGVTVTIGAREGEGRKRALEDGFSPIPISNAANAQIVVMTAPDLAMGEVYAQVEPNLPQNANLIFAHGFSVRYGVVKPRADLNVLLVSPKGAGDRLRSLYLAGSGLAAMVAVHQDSSGMGLETALSYVWGVGCARVGALLTTIAEETEADLFGEQAVLCGGIPELLKMAFEVMVEAGYQPEAAYIECIHEAKLILDLVYARGIAGMRDRISDTAMWGGLTEGPRVIQPEARAAMKQALARIQNGDFAKEWLAESAAGRAKLTRLREEEREHHAVATFEGLRKAMPTLGQ